MTQPDHPLSPGTLVYHHGQQRPSARRGTAVVRDAAGRR